MFEWVGQTLARSNIDHSYSFSYGRCLNVPNDYTLPSKCNNDLVPKQIIKDSLWSCGLIYQVIDREVRGSNLAPIAFKFRVFLPKLDVGSQYTKEVCERLI